jgi:acylphosphatase
LNAANAAARRARRRSAEYQLGRRPSISVVITRRFLITGKVQGVYFRHSTRLQADRLDVRGVARNLPDGSVEVIAQGTPEAVKSLREWLHRGPSGARVAAVQEFELPAEHPSAGDPSGEQVGEDQDGHSMRSFWVE